MDIYGLGIFVALLLALCLYLILRRAEKRHEHPIVQFGPRKRSDTTEEERKLLFHNYLKQQRWSFWLLWFTVALGVVIAASLIGRLIVAREMNIATISTVIGFAGDIWLGKKAKDMDKAASARLEKLFEIT